MSAENQEIETGRTFHLRFSLFALLVLVTLACLVMGWWKFVYLEKQHLLARRDVVSQKISDTNEKIADKWKTYLAIAEDSQQFELPLLESATRQIDRLDVELLRLENQVSAGEASDGKARESKLRQRIGELRDQRNDLQREVERRSEPSVELEMLKREIERLQQIVDVLTQKLMDLDIEIETRGLSGKSAKKAGR